MKAVTRNTMKQYENDKSVTGNEKAMDELMAEWMPSLLTDDTALAELLGYNESVAKKFIDAVKEFLHQFVMTMRQFYGITHPAYLEASGLEAEFKTRVERLMRAAADNAKAGTDDAQYAPANTEIRNSIRDGLANELEKILHGNFPDNSLLEIGETSPFLTEVIGINPYGVFMPYRKAYAAMASKRQAIFENRYDKNVEFHELGPDGLISALKKSETLVIAIAASSSENKERENSIILITDDKDINGNFVVVIDALEDKTIQNKKYIDANKVITAYGHRNIEKIINDGIKENRILYFDKNKISSFSNLTRVQFPSNITNADLNNNIQNFLSKVKLNGIVKYNRKSNTDPESQAISSAATSIKQVPALFKNKNVKFKGINIDIGGGKFDEATDFLKSVGTKNLVFDPYNRSAKVNGKTLTYLLNGNKADTATVANVLNVINEPGARANVILEAAKVIKDDGVAYFMVYEGSGTGEGRETSAGYQNNRKTADYVPEIKRYFGNVERKGKLIIAKEPKVNGEKALWEVTPGEAVRYSAKEDSEGNALTPDQIKYFAESKARDEQGRLKVVYHGTDYGGWTVFNNEFSDDELSFFFSGSRSVAGSYTSGTAKLDIPKLDTSAAVIKYMDDPANKVDYEIIVNLPDGGMDDFASWNDYLKKYPLNEYPNGPEDMEISAQNISGNG